MGYYLWINDKHIEVPHELYAAYRLLESQLKPVDQAMTTVGNGRFHLFAGKRYYPAGGFGDFICRTGSVESCLQSVTAEHDWFHVVDILKEQVVESGEPGYFLGESQWTPRPIN